MRYIQKFESISSLSVKKILMVMSMSILGGVNIGHAFICKENLPTIFKKVRDGDIKLKKNEMYLHLINRQKIYW